MGRRRTRSNHVCPPTPLHQGELDGLCGIYAVINALRTLCPEMPRELCDELFALQLAAVSDDRSSPLDVVTNGIGKTTLRGLIGLSCDEMFLRSKVTLHCRSLLLKRNAPLDAIWSEVERLVAGGGVVIAGLSGRYDHWTVVRKATPRRLTLVDSSMLQILDRRFCTTAWSNTHYRLRADEMYVLFRA